MLLQVPHCVLINLKGGYMKESDIIYETNGHYVAVTKTNGMKYYTVFKPCYGGSVVESDSSYAYTDNGLSIAKARMKYLSNRYN